MRRYLLLLPALLCSGPGLAEPLPAAVKNEAPYDSARAELLESGWAAAGKSQRMDGSCPDYDERCAAHEEARECSGTGLGLCNMVWRHADGTELVITTAGEEDLTITGVDVTLKP